MLRGHGTIENRLHRVKDVTLAEDQRTLHTGQGPIVLQVARRGASLAEGPFRVSLSQCVDQVTGSSPVSTRSARTGWLLSRRKRTNSTRAMR